MKTSMDESLKSSLPFAALFVLSLPVLFGSAIHTCGQGRLAFQNSGTTLISTNSVHGGSAAGPTEPYQGSGDPGFVYALFAAPSTVTSVSGVMDANWSFTGAYATNTAFAGRLFGGVISLPSPYAPGTTFSFLVRGWSSSIAGQDWATVQAFVQNFEINPNASGSLGQFFGTSSIATTEIGGGTLPTQAIFGTTPGITIPGFLLDQVPVPEPSPFSLLAMGILASAVRIVRSRKAGK